MRVRNNPNAKEELCQFDRFLQDKEALQKVLEDSKEVFVEIGMGKGDFLLGMALANPDVLFVGVELSETVLSIAIKKIKKYEEENGIILKNLYVMSFDAIEVANYFPSKQIDKLFLNFSDPWPKKKHAKRRLTNEKFLTEYTKVLKKNGIIEFKTDNRGLFEYSLLSIQHFGMEFLEVYLDLHQPDIPNVETEYESKFSSKGPIYKLVCQVKEV